MPHLSTFYDVSEWRKYLDVYFPFSIFVLFHVDFAALYFPYTTCLISPEVLEEVCLYFCGNTPHYIDELFLCFSLIFQNDTLPQADDKAH